MYFFHFFRVYRCTAYLFILCLRYSKRVGWCAWQIVGCTPVHSMYLFVVTLKYVYRDAVHRLYTGCTQAVHRPPGFFMTGNKNAPVVLPCPQTIAAAVGWLLCCSKDFSQ